MPSPPVCVCCSAASPTEESPGTLVVLSDGETTRGRPTADGAQVAADANVPVYTIAFGTEDGTITNPDTGEIDPVPVKLDELQGAADATGGKAYVAPSADELAKAYEDIRANLQQTTGDAVTTIPNSRGGTCWRQSSC